MLMPVITHLIAVGVGIAIMAVFGLPIRKEIRRMQKDAAEILKGLKEIKEKNL